MVIRGDLADRNDDRKVSATTFSQFNADNAKLGLKYFGVKFYDSHILGVVHLEQTERDYKPTTVWQPPQKCRQDELPS